MVRRGSEEIDMPPRTIAFPDLSPEEQARIMAASTRESGDFRFDLFEVAMVALIKEKYGLVPIGRTP